MIRFTEIECTFESVRLVTRSDDGYVAVALRVTSRFRERAVLYCDPDDNVSNIEVPRGRAGNEGLSSSLRRGLTRSELAASTNRRLGESCSETAPPTAVEDRSGYSREPLLHSPSAIARCQSSVR